LGRKHAGDDINLDVHPMDTLTPLERAILEKILSGDSDICGSLRKQISTLQVRERKMTGVGFFTRFMIPAGVPKPGDGPTFQIGGVAAHIDHLEHGAGFLLFIVGGRLKLSKPTPTTSHGLRMLVALAYATSEPKKEPNFASKKIDVCRGDSGASDALRSFDEWLPGSGALKDH
jgi:hypothetical protein